MLLEIREVIRHSQNKYVSYNYKKYLKFHKSNFNKIGNVSLNFILYYITYN